MGHAPKIAAEKQNDWNLEQAVQETEKIFSTDLQLLMTETTNDANVLKTLERRQQDMIPEIPEEYKTHRRKLLGSIGLVFLEDN